MTQVVRVLAKTPRHDSAEILRLDNLRELPRNEARRVPSPEQIDAAVEVVLATGLFVGRPVLLRLAPRSEDVNALADAVIKEAASTAVGIARAAVPGR